MARPVAYKDYLQLLPVVGDAGPLAPRLAGVDDLAPAMRHERRPRPEVFVVPLRTAARAPSASGSLWRWRMMALAIVMLGAAVLLAASH